MPAAIRKLQRPLIVTVFDAASEGGGKACWVLVRVTKADTLESATVVAKLASFQAVRPGKIKQWAIAKIGHVRTLWVAERWSAPRAKNVLRSARYLENLTLRGP
jgi:hypothetical protein